MNKGTNECSYGNIMRFCKHIMKRELKRGYKYKPIQDRLIKAVEEGCAKGVVEIFNETGFDIKEMFYAPKRENNRNEEHTYKKD